MENLLFDDTVTFGSAESTVSGSSIDVSCETLNSFDLLANFSPNSATLPEPYLTYMVSYVADMPVTYHYVIFVTTESAFVSGSTRTVTVYNLARGSDLQYSSGVFSGSVELIKIYSNATYFNQFNFSQDNSFRLTPGTSLVYTDLTNIYPSLNMTRHTLNIWYLFVCIIVFFTITYFFRRRK